MQMRYNTIVSKIFLTLLVFGIVLWLGGAIVRTSIAYEIFMPFSQMELKTEYTNAVRMHTVKLFTYGSLYTGTGFIMAFVGFAALGFYWREYLKKQGWMIMALFLFFIAVPWGFYELLLDIKLTYLIKGGEAAFNDKLIKELFVNRFSKLAPWATISYMSVIAAVFIIIWRPLQNLQKKNSGGNDETK